ncbi:MAG: YigZ family protein [Anaerolineales bacterium]|nr:YigZ family protein [Anaerolineales bacterium]
MPHRIIPARTTSTEITVVNSRFIATAAPAFSIEAARAFIQQIKEKYADASHNVPAFIIGHGASITEHCSDDGEPEGTAGRPALAVLKGSGLGDVVVVITRYFGGTKLGTGGLVRAYSDAMRAVLEALPKAEKIATHTVGIEMPYKLYEQIKLLVEAQHGLILDQDFAADVTIMAQFKQDDLPDFQTALQELSRGGIQAEILESNQNSIFPIKD